MKKKGLFILLAAILVLSLLLGACGGGAEPVVEEPAVKAPTEEAEEAAMETPTEVRIALILNSAAEEPWNLVHIDAINQLIEEEAAKGVSVSYVYTENVWGDAVELAMRQYADEDYDIIWNAGGAADAVEAVMDEYPDKLFVITGSGGKAFGRNALWVYLNYYEPSYVMGVIAGMVTESDVIGVVAGFPGSEVNGAVNAYRAGAQSVNPDVAVKITFIDSWYDPPKAKEATTAQIAAGADVIYGERYGVLEALNENGVLGFGNYLDENEAYPDVVVTSPLLKAFPVTRYMYDMWWDAVTSGEPFDGDLDRVWFQWSDGGTDIAPFHNFEDTLPQEVLDKVAETKAAILDGSLIVPLEESQPVSD